METCKKMKSGLFACFALLVACGHEEQAPPKTESTIGLPSASASAAPTSSEAPTNGNLTGVPIISNDDPVSITNHGTESGTPTPVASEACSAAAEGYRVKIKDGVNACYQQGKAKNPFLSGRFKLTVAIDAQGKGGGARAESGSALGQTVVDCMVNAAKAVPFQDASCKGKSLTVVRVYGSE